METKRACLWPGHFWCAKELGKLAGEGKFFLKTYQEESIVKMQQLSNEGLRAPVEVLSEVLGRFALEVTEV
jgi:hypothetical protein